MDVDPSSLEEAAAFVEEVQIHVHVMHVSW